MAGRALLIPLLLPLLLLAGFGCGKKGPPVLPERAQVLTGDSR